jgi:IS5 family transposase
LANEADDFSFAAAEYLRQSLKPRTIHKNRNTIEYKADKKACAHCDLRDKCTESKSGRTIMRHLRQKDLDSARRQAASEESKKDLQLRQHIIEGTFGQDKRYGYKRARWRRLWRVSIQDYLVCTVHNIQKLVKYNEVNAIH